MQLTNLVLKTTFDCPCSCPQCATRQTFFSDEQLKHLPYLSFNRIKELLKEANKLGTKKLQISGGDPLLYHHLIELISEANKYSWFIFVNSVGWNVSKEFAESLVNAGLNAFNISFDSVNASKHNTSRGMGGLFSSAINTLRIFKEIKKEKPIYTNIQFIIMKQNYKELPKLFELAIDLGVDSIYFMYIYGDAEHKFSLNTSEIMNFKNNVIPEVIKVIESKLPNRIVEYIKPHLNDLYSTKTNTVDNYSKGIYWDDVSAVKNACKAPMKTVLILPNGNVLPCCNMEHENGVILGNVQNTSLTKIWNSEKTVVFRRDRNPYCILCPSVRNKTIGLVESMLQQFN